MGNIEIPKLLKIKKWVDVSKASSYLTKILEEHVSSNDVLDMVWEGSLKLSINVKYRIAALCGELVKLDRDSYEDYLRKLASHQKEQDFPRPDYSLSPLQFYTPKPKGIFFKTDFGKKREWLTGVWDLPLEVTDRRMIWLLDQEFSSSDWSKDIGNRSEPHVVLDREIFITKDNRKIYKCKYREVYNEIKLVVRSQALMDFQKQYFANDKIEHENLSSEQKPADKILDSKEESIINPGDKLPKANGDLEDQINNAENCFVLQVDKWTVKYKNSDRTYLNNNQKVRYMAHFLYKPNHQYKHTELYYAITEKPIPEEVDIVATGITDKNNFPEKDKKALEKLTRALSKNIEDAYKKGREDSPETQEDEGRWRGIKSSIKIKGGTLHEDGTISWHNRFEPDAHTRIKDNVNRQIRRGKKYIAKKGPKDLFKHLNENIINLRYTPRHLRMVRKVLI